MAKVKKQELSMEEKLAQALVPEDEQPYKVPENWVWTRLGDIIQVIMGQSPKGVDTTDDDRYIGLIGGAADMGGLFPEVSRYTVKPTKLSQKDDVIVSIRATLGRPIYSDGEYCIGRGVCALRSGIMSSSFIRYFILNFEDYLYNVATGTTFAQVSKNDIEKMPFPLTPFSEQQRIVDRIESLFEKLDHAKELAQNALDTFETRKAAILHKAFTGELTAKWREQHWVGMDSWEEKSLKDMCSKITDGEHFRPPIVDFGIPFLSAKDIRDDGVSFNDVLYISKDVAEKALKRCNPEKGDILIVSRGATVGRMCIVDTDDVFCLLGSVILLKVHNIQNKLLCYYMKSPTISQKLKEISGSTAQQAIYLRDIKEIVVPIPSISEQQEIVRILDSLFEKEQKAKELCEIIDKIELMKKAILARAFRGKLGTNDPKEESAIELLKEYLK